MTALSWRIAPRMMHMKSRRSTTTLTLVLIGAAALHGCGGDEDEKTATRDVYKSRADCQRDWGEDAAKCEPQTSGPHAGMFYGPLMYGLGAMSGRSGFNNRMSSARPGSSAVGSAHVPGSAGGTSRGGFGSSARSHSSGG
jgi:uncharacterized protein YgiB involved in biofilm formation